MSDRFPERRVEPGDLDPQLATTLDWRRLNAVPLRSRNGTRAVAVADPSNVVTLDAIRRALGYDVEIYRAPAADITLALETSGLLSGDLVEDDLQARSLAEELANRANEAPVVNLVNLILREGLASGASDIHIEATEDGARVMNRVDGIKLPVMRISRTDHLMVISRIKVLASMDLAERRLPQDGRIRVRDQSGEILDIRVNTIPSNYGECACLRILRREAQVTSLEALGMRPQDLQRVRAALSASWGMVLAAGPTGCGKSTTLSLFLRQVASPERETITIEDPVEYQIPHAHQVQVNEKAGLTFAVALRAFVRHDPDIIMVGEIRDRETAEIATRAAMTGHLVFSTVHTNDAPTAPVRLVDMGVEPFLVASSLTLVVAQRLVRRVCPECSRQVAVPPDLRAALPPETPTSQMQGAGCDRCRGTGYMGRTAIFEVMRITPRIRSLIISRADASEIALAAREDGTRTLVEDGIRLVGKGVTTVQEVLRVARLEET